MNIFISWSGQRSHAVAELMCEWIKCVLQASRPWISSRDIDRGALWFTEIADQLKDTSVGIVCLTQDNKEKPWILFETGALAKGLSSNRVCTFLIDLTPADLTDPLAQFNHTTFSESSLLQLVRTINSTLSESRLDEKILEKVFNTYWPQFEQRFKKIINDVKPETTVPPRNETDILSEILSHTRSLNSRLREIEDRLEDSKDPISPHGISQKVIDLLVHRINQGFSDSDLRKTLSSYNIPPWEYDELIQRAINISSHSSRPQPVPPPPPPLGMKTPPPPPSPQKK